MARFSPISLSDLPAGAWRHDWTIRFGECDPAGIVYTPQYFNILNAVIERWYGEALGLSYYALIGERRVGLGYAHASADFATPGKMGEMLDVAIIIEAIGRSSLTLRAHIFKDGMESVRARFVTVTTSIGPNTVMPLPDDLRAAFEAYAGACGGAGQT